MVFMMVCSSLGMGIYQLNQKANQIKEEFMIGAQQDGLSIQKDLDTRVSCATNLVTLAQKYQMDHLLIEPVEEAIQQLKQADTVSEKYQSNEELSNAVTKLRMAMDEVSMNDLNTKSMKEQFSIFNNAQKTISYDPYNSLVAKYEKETQGVLASLLKKLTYQVEYFR